MRRSPMRTSLHACRTRSLRRKMTSTTKHGTGAPMLVAAGHRAISRRPAASAVAIGNFDGVHRGHQRLFAEVVAQAGRRGAVPVVLTFEPHPARLLSPAFAPPLITPLSRKLELLEAAGIALCVVEPFDRALAALSPAEFVDQVLVGALGAAHVCIGYDFTFGKNRGGDAEALRAIGQRRGFAVTVIEPVSVDGIVCSSTKVREFILEGRVEGAALLLGRDVEIEGEVVRGAGRGRALGVPTANLRATTELLPRGGVYAGWARRADGRHHDAAINLGENPTFAGNGGGGAAMTIEAHLIDHDGSDLYGEQVRLGLSTRLRDEARFASVDALKAQIARDIEAAREAGRMRRSAVTSMAEGA
jgi:riboflavin kinase/FMN adenylyltransferase